MPSPEILRGFVTEDVVQPDAGSVIVSLPSLRLLAMPNIILRDCVRDPLGRNTFVQWAQAQSWAGEKY